MLSLFCQINLFRKRILSILQPIANIKHLLLTGILVHEQVKGLSFSAVLHVLEYHSHGSSGSCVQFEVGTAMVVTTFHVGNG